MKKDVKNYSYNNLPQEDLDLISKTCEEYAKAYNYFSERYSGIKSIVIQVASFLLGKIFEILYIKMYVFEERYPYQ